MSTNTSLIKLNLHLEKTAKLCGLSVSDITMKTRRRDIVEARQIYCYTAMNKGFSLNLIGKQISKDHATVIHSVKTVKTLLESDKAYKKIYSYVIERLDKSLLDIIQSCDVVFVYGHLRSDWKYTKTLFEVRSNKIEEKGFIACNPVEGYMNSRSFLDDKKRIYSILLKCNAIHFLDKPDVNDHDSIEIRIANELQFKVITEKELFNHV